MARYGADLIANDYRIIPILPGMKAPGSHQRGFWTPYPEWSKHCDRETRGYEIDIWRTWPDCAVGIACGNVIGVDIDVLDADAAARIESLARQMLGDTPAKRIGMAPKRMLVYRVETPFQGIKRHPLEVLARGNQFVAYAIHPTTGQPYTWPDEDLTAIDVSRLPLVTEAQCRAFLEAAWPLVPAELRQARLVAGDGAPHEGSDDLRGTPEAVAEALRHIPNNDLNWDDWIKIGLALKGALGDAGRDLWLDWSDQSAKNHPKVSAKEWSKFKPDRIGAGTIYWLAEQAGWVPDQALTLNATQAEIADLPAVDFSEFISSVLTRAASEQKQTEVATGIMDVDGVLAELVDYMTRTAHSPQPFLALGASLAFIGALAGRRYESPTGFRTNVFALGLAASGSGKEQARKCIKHLAAECGLDAYLSESLASAQGIYGALQVHPSKLFLFNEFGHFIAGANGRNASEHKRDIIPTLTRLFTQAEQKVSGAEYAKQTGKGAEQRQDVYQPHLCVYGDTVPGVLWGALRSGSLQDGALARYLVFQSPNNSPEPNFDAERITTIPDGLLDRLKAVAAGVPGHDYGGDLAALMSAKVPMTPYTVPYGPGAKDLARQQIMDQHRWHKENSETWAAAFIARGFEHASTLATIRAISRDPANPMITVADMQWAQRLTEHCLVTVMREVEANVADSAVEGNLKRLLSFIQKSGPKGISKTDLAKITRFVSTRERTQIIADLKDTGEVFELSQREEGANKATTRYTASPSAMWGLVGKSENAEIAH